MITQTAQETYTTAAARIAEKHPSLAGMAAKALDIAENGRINRLAEARVYVRSTSGREYCLNFTQGRGWICNCPAFSHRPAVINGRRYCKHVMALGIYNRVKGS